ncbi:zinc finger CCCH domain-containing protein 14 isoform X2 [Neocloeon triangulifer]|uniref:zinc finger CCCH domain-containing protein 14 isoform X2 n=1 Tax=Neocloeon triangulifer TaxID=2078957 RepID=UPI00286EE3A1|nr:zinc finger CCCH domain-containing protein 14 isoform X2 [Neocloeon triangulifer]
MELVCSEVGKKIRSAIKVRLMELGKTVDDELVDYIMVMAANKKEEAQMAKDLQPFLEEDTVKFTSWLQKVLKKLEQITVTVTDNDYKVATPAVVAKKPKTGVEGVKKKSKDEGKDKKKKTKVTKESPEGGKKIKVVKIKAAGKSATEVKSKATVVKVKKTVKEEPKSPLESAPSTSGLQSSVVLRVDPERRSENVQQVKAREPVMMTSDVDEDDDDFINIKTDLNEEEELLGDEQPNGNKISRHEKLSSDHDSESSRSRSSYRNNNQAITTAELRARRNLNRSHEDSRSPQIAVRSQVVAAKRKSPSPPPRVSVMSRIGAVLKRKAEEEEDDVKPRSVASVVRIKPRTTLPPEARPSKFLLLKAINEAQKSITTSRSRSFEEEEEEDPRPKLFTKNLKNRLGAKEKIQITLRNLPVEKKYTLEEDEDEEMNSGDAYVPEITSSRSNPPFLITLDGYEEYSNKYLRATAEDIEMLQEEGVEMEIIDEAQLVGDATAPSKPKRKRIVFTPEPEEPMVTEPVKKSTERCKFWPACRQGDGCQFHHPSTTCTNFPNCNFGDRCLYIHPNCKFDAACTRKDCPFTHASPRSFNPVPVVPKFVPAPIIRPLAPVKPSAATVCRFFPGCTNMTCRFFHPKPCRFGANCKNFGCIFTHPEVAPVTKLKWVNTASV